MNRETAAAAAGSAATAAEARRATRTPASDATGTPVLQQQTTDVAECLGQEYGKARSQGAIDDAVVV